MRIHVMYSGTTCVTGKALVRELDHVINVLGLGGQRAIVTGGRQASRITPGLLVRWGNSDPVYESPAKEFNPAGAIHKSADKLQMLKEFKMNHVACPNVWPSSEFRHIRWPVIVRGRYHCKGQQFYEANSNMELMQYANPQYYACSIVDVAEEYRVFVFDTKVMEINKKTQEGIVAHRRNAKIRNHDNGWVCRRGGFDVPEGVRSVARAATMAVGLTLGACDVYVDTQGRVGIFEVNSAPGLVTRKLRKLALKIVNKYMQPIPDDAFMAAMSGITED